MRTNPIPALLPGLGAVALLLAALLVSSPAGAAPALQPLPTATEPATTPAAVPTEHPGQPPTSTPAAVPPTPAGSPVATTTAGPAASPTARRPGPPTPRPYTNRPRAPFPTIVYTDTALSSLEGVWLGELTVGANIRRGPGITFPVDRVWPATRRVLVYTTTLALNGEKWHQVSHYPDPTLYVHSDLVKQIAPLAVPTQTQQGKWIDVNLTQQTLIAYVDARPVLLAQISSGKPGFETEIGSWRIYWRTPKQDMDGGGVVRGDPYYNIKDVPWVQYFHNSGEGLHGAYWHDLFGRPRSHGCVNLSIQHANWLYLWAAKGTPVIVHK
jgi:lipoprotein-anchoring transpeptidase ErfK/SrfK